MRTLRQTAWDVWIAVCCLGAALPALLLLAGFDLLTVSGRILCAGVSAGFVGLLAWKPRKRRR
jgi:hypothetical protein